MYSLYNVSVQCNSNYLRQASFKLFKVFWDVFSLDPTSETTFVLGFLQAGFIYLRELFMVNFFNTSIFIYNNKVYRSRIVDVLTTQSVPEYFFCLSNPLIFVIMPEKIKTTCSLLDTILLCKQTHSDTIFIQFVHTHDCRQTSSCLRV